MDAGSPSINMSAGLCVVTSQDTEAHDLQDALLKISLVYWDKNLPPSNFHSLVLLSLSKKLVFLGVTVL